VINVSWNDAQAYVAWLAKTTGKPYRLLSEAEREYVARAGTKTAYWWGPSMTAEQANDVGSRARTLPVDALSANPWGLYQVHGNVWEWVEDCDHDSYVGAPNDGSAWTDNCRSFGFRILRGGSWVSDAKNRRAATRYGLPPTNRDSDKGFRVARTLAKIASLESKAAPVRVESDRLVALVNGEQVHQSDLSFAEKEIGPKVQLDPGTRQKKLIDYVIDMKLVARAAEARRLQDSEEVKKKLDLVRSQLPDDGTKSRRYAFYYEKVLSDAMDLSWTKEAEDEGAFRKIYEDAAKMISGEQEVHARQILVATEEEAKAVRADLDRGADFGELAKKKSYDPGAADGGDLGFFTKGQLPSEFSDVAFTLEPGQISGPVKSQYGWHIIKVEEKRTRRAPPFEQVRQQIMDYYLKRFRSDYVAKMRETAKVTVYD
jgi:peptidyl-prolyl cis-trans isomerase C